MLRARALLLRYDAGQDPFTPEGESFAVCLDEGTVGSLGWPSAATGST